MTDKIEQTLKEIRSDLLEHYNEDVKRLSSIEKCIIRMEEDIAHHIRRTDQVEDMLKPMWKMYIGLKWSFGALLGLSAIIAALGKIKGLI